LAKEGRLKGERSILFAENRDLHYQPHLTEIMDAIGKGDPFAISILEETGRNLGKGIAILIQLFNPELIVLGGKMTSAGHYLLEAVKASVTNHTLEQVSRNCKIELSDPESDLGIASARAVVIEHLFEKEISKNQSTS
jgi:N-acetylglucosamine repressor